MQLHRHVVFCHTHDFCYLSIVIVFEVQRDNRFVNVAQAANGGIESVSGRVVCVPFLCDVPFPDLLRSQSVLLSIESKNRVQCHSVKPRTKRRFATEAPDGLPGLQDDFLPQVIFVIRVVHVQVDHLLDDTRVFLYVLNEGLLFQLAWYFGLALPR